jgi:hypothetical protein
LGAKQFPPGSVIKRVALGGNQEDDGRQLFLSMAYQSLFPRRNRRCSFLLTLLGGICCASGTTASAEEINFNRDIRPLLSKACIMCHGPDEHERKGGSKDSGGLRVDTFDGVQMDLGGKKAIVPGHPEQSELIARITTTDPDDVMPPPKHGKKLSSEEVNLLTAWIKGGAKYTKHWSYETPVRPAVPGAAGHPVDAFIQQRLAKEGLKQQPEADRLTLARRVTLDVTGLPPSPEAVAAFVNDTAPQAYERFVDKLLATPAYGEHWGREWLDLARYADSAGYADDGLRSMWGFRDYVINSFNANKPFDQFTIEQIAGDLLPSPTDDQLVATAFHRNTMTNSEGGTNDEEFRTAAIVDRVNTTMAVWMGTSMACAQCHTHKYDPITQKEYFQIYAFLNNTADADRQDESPLHKFFSDEQKAQKRTFEQEITAVEAKFKSPTAEQLSAAQKWSQAFAVAPKWDALKPTSMESTAKLAMTLEPDGAIQVAKTAPKDTYKLDVSIPSSRNITALKLEALPHETLPANGPGHGGGNFVVTRLRAMIEPPAGSKGPKARFVRIELPGKDKILQLAEVQVFSGAANIAQQGTASQQSTYTDAVASRANDGNTSGEYDKGSVAHSAVGSTDPWWEVDLKTEQQLARIVVWNRAEAGERLEGFRIVALDEKRNQVWEQKQNKAAESVPFALNGQREIVFAAAAADFTQPDFDEDTVISDAAPAPPKKKQKARGAQKGWAVGGQPGKAHELILATASGVEIPAGSKLHFSIEQQSASANHTLGRFRLSLTDDPAALLRLDIPAAVATIVAQPTAQRSKEQAGQVASYYLSEIAPEMASERVKLADLRKKIESIQPSTVPILQERAADKRRQAHVQLRGNYLSLGDPVVEGVPVAFHPLPEKAPMNRLTLARWLVDDKNPLTPRVIANRYWDTIFGIGLVRTSEEFGSQGELPSHPELLDWLATELVRTKWDMKKFVKLLVTSATYKQSSKVAAGAMERDPENRLLARGPRFRLSAEMVRDQALAVGGLLSPKMLGPSVRPARPSSGLSAAFGGGLDWQTSGGEDRFRRALYTEWRRTSPYPSMTTFDAPNRETCTLRRGRTNTPLQALVTLNDPVYIEAAQGLARRLISGTTEEKITQAYRLVLSRNPSDKERQRLVQLYQETLAVYQQDAKKASEMATNPIGALPAGANAAELATWTTISSIILNLDETLMKR